MSGDGVRPVSTTPADTVEVKQCCARLYETDVVRRLLGDSFHPGGTALTERLGVLLGLSPASVVLDSASGIGTSALFLAQRFGCHVVGIDLGVDNVARANEAAARLGLSHRVQFKVGDAEQLPLNNAEVDAVICECAFCTFPDKSTAANEFARVLRPSGRVGLSDVTRSQGPPGELSDLMAWVACLGDARTAASYAQWLLDAGFIQPYVENHDEALAELVRSVAARLLATEVMAALGKLDLAGLDLTAAKRLAKEALAAVSEQRLGYAIVCARRADLGSDLP